MYVRPFTVPGSSFLAASRTSVPFFTGMDDGSFFAGVGRFCAAANETHNKSKMIAEIDLIKSKVQAVGFRPLRGAFSLPSARMFDGIFPAPFRSCRASAGFLPKPQAPQGDPAPNFQARCGQANFPHRSRSYRPYRNHPLDSLLSQKDASKPSRCPQKGF